MVRVTFLLPEKKSGLPKVGMRADLPTTQKGLWPRLATTTIRQAVGIYRSFLLRQRHRLPSALRGLNALKGFKDLGGPSRPSCHSLLFLLFWQQTPPPFGHPPSNSEGDVHRDVHTISTTPPDLPYRRGGVLGGATQCLWLSPLSLGYLF